MSRVKPRTPNLPVGQQPQPLIDSHSLCIHLYATKAKGTPPVLSSFDKVLTPQSPLLQPPRAEHARGSFWDGVPWHTQPWDPWAAGLLIQLCLAELN